MLTDLVGKMMSPKQKAAMITQVMQSWAAKFAKELGCPASEVRLLIYVGENGIPAGQLFHKNVKVRDVTLAQFVE